ncbi:MAG: OmpW family protein, partial [Methylophilaceae bacterium]
MKKTLVALAVCATLIPSLAMAEAGDIVVRLRATHIAPDESSDLGQKTAAAGLNPTILYGSPTADLKVDSNTIPELD